MLYALINKTGIHRLEVAEKLELADLQNRVGIEGEDAYIEYLRHQFTDPDIDLICDEEFLHKKLPLTCITRRSIALCGQVIAAACTEDGDTIGLTEAQFQLVAANLTFALIL
ncbi:hypothetical protein QT995_17070 [Microcoleus sp. S36b_A3]|uniref:DUF3846 domain-containing protein n=1 Tax=unclassified Microcoleus TaxID=2642155 RepID=UPI002FD21B37